MTFQIVRANDARVTETPNAVMTTLASPSVIDSKASLWVVNMQANATGPVHAMDSEQIWHVLKGSVQCEIEGNISILEPGDTIRIAGGVTRQLTAIFDVTLVVNGESSAVATTDDKSVVPPWIS